MVLGGEGLPSRLVIVVVVVVRGRFGFGALPNILSALLEMFSLRASSSSTSHFSTACVAAARQCARTGILESWSRMFGVGPLFM